MKLINNILTIAITAFCFVGCDSFLEDEIQYTSEDEILTSGIRSRGIITAIYSDYAFQYTRDFVAENLTDNSVQSKGVTANTNLNWQDNSSHPYYTTWAKSYDNIRRVYEYLALVHDTGIPFFPSEASSDVSDNIVQRYYGEAYFLKAWAQWELLKIYGGPDATGTMKGFPIVDHLYETKIDANTTIYNTNIVNEDFAKISRDNYDDCRFNYERSPNCN